MSGLARTPEFDPRASVAAPRRVAGMIWHVLRIADPARIVALKKKVEFLLRADCGRSLRVTSRAELLAHGRASVSIGVNAVIDGTLEVYGKGQLHIGDHVFVGRSRIYAAHSVRIGNYALISDGVCIMDSDLHPVDFRRRRLIAESIQTHTFPDVYTGVVGAPVEIEDDVWIGYGAAILKGVRLGRGAIVGAGAVVTGDVAPWTIAAGIPARPVGSVPQLSSSHPDLATVCSTNTR